jgi:hypothetical protein
MESSCKHDNEHSGFVICRGLAAQLVTTQEGFNSMELVSVGLRKDAHFKSTLSLPLSPVLRFLKAHIDIDIGSWTDIRLSAFWLLLKKVSHRGNEGRETTDVIHESSSIFPTTSVWLWSLYTLWAMFCPRLICGIVSLRCTWRETLHIRCFWTLVSKRRLQISTLIFLQVKRKQLPLKGSNNWWCGSVLDNKKVE